MSRMAARTSHRVLVGRRDRELQELGQGCRASPMHGRAHGHFDGFQIQASCLTAAVEDRAQQLLYFARDLLAERFGRFFSSGEKLSSTGRARQIRSLASSNS